MLEMAHVLNGIQTMAFDCPVNGNVSVEFVVHNEKIQTASFSKTTAMVLDGTQVHQEKVHPISAEFAHRIFTDVQNLRLKYGTIKISVEIKNGEVKEYSVTPAYSLTANLLKAEMRSHANRQLKKQELAQTA